MVQLVKILSNDPAGKSTTYLADDGNTYTLTGDLSQRANNPANISPTSTRSLYEGQFGAIGYLPSSRGQPAVAVFPTLDQGVQAQQYLWSTPAYQNKTIAQAASSWASAPYTSQLAAAAGVGSDTRISDLSPQQMASIFSAQTQAEGSGNLRVSNASGNPVPPSIIRGSAADAAAALAGAPTNPALAYAPDSPMAGLYGAPPAPLSAPRADSAASSLPPIGDLQSFFGIGNPSLAYNPANPAPAQHITDQNYQVGGLAPPNLSLDMPWYSSPPPLPRPRPAPPSIMPQTAGVPAPHLVNLNGKMVAPGTYASPSNPGSTFTVADDGTGKGVVKNNDPGFMNVAKMGSGTVAGSVVGKTIGDATKQAKASVGQVAANVGASATQLGSNIAGLGGNLLNGIGGLFGHPPAPPPSGLPSSPSHGQVTQGADGKQYQYVQLTGGNFNSPAGAWGWEQTSAPPKPAVTPYPGDMSRGGVIAPPPVPKPYPGDLSSGGVSQSIYPGDLSLGGTSTPPLNLGIPPPSVATIKAMTAAPAVIPKSIGAVVPPVPFGNPSWLAPVIPQSAVFANNPIAQAVQQSKYGNAAQFLSGSQNNYSYLNNAASQMGVPAASLHAALMAQQNRSQGGPVGSPSNFNSSYFESAI